MKFSSIYDSQMVIRCFYNENRITYRVSESFLFSLSRFINAVSMFFFCASTGELFLINADERRLGCVWASVVISKLSWFITLFVCIPNKANHCLLSGYHSFGPIDMH